MKAALTVSSIVAAAGFVSAGPPSRHLIGRDARHATDNNKVQARAACNADNCARAVTGTYQGTATVAAHKADCSSFFSYTVIPAATTSTVTFTPAPKYSTETVIDEVFTTVEETVPYYSTTNVEVYSTEAANKRQATMTGLDGAETISPTAVPAYASACSGTARFSSACSCFGVTKATTTAPTPTVYTTVTAPQVTKVVDVTETSFFTATATTSVLAGTYVDKIYCNQPLIGGYDGFTIDVVCEAAPANPGTVLSADPVADWDSCAYSADSNYEATSFTFNLATSICTIYHDSDDTFATTPAKGVVFGYFPQAQ